MEIDNLSISINAKAKSANEAIDRLIGKLDSLTASMRKLNPSNLNGLANGVQKLGIAMQTMKDVKKTDFNKVARGISAFEKIDSTKLSSLSTTLSPLATSIGTLGAVKFDNRNVQTLINSLTRLSNANLNALSSVDFTQFGNSISQLSTSLNKVPKIQQSVISMTNAIASLAKSGANIPVVASSLQTLGGELSRFMSVMASAPSVTDSTVTFTQAISSLANAGSKAGVTASNLGVLGAQLKNLMATLSTAPLVSQNVIDMTNALANLSTQGSKVGSASRSIQRSLNGTATSTARASKGFNGLASAIGKFYASYFMVIRGVKGIWSSIESTADYIEAYNYFNVALGKIGSDWKGYFNEELGEKLGISTAEEYAESFNKRLTEALKDLSGVQISMDYDGTGLLTDTGMKNLGLNIQEVTQYASQLASVTNSVGQTGEVSLAAANAFTKLGADMSSLFNMDYSQVMKNLQSGLIGQSRALYRYGLDITNATLQTYAYELGLSKAVSEMTQAEKMQLRMIAILDQSKVSWGDLANTINSPSNLMRIFKNNLKETGMMLGQLFIPMLSKVIPILNGVTIAFKRLLVNIASFMGVELDLDAFGQGYNDLEDDTGSLGDSYDDLAESIKVAKAQLLGFDEVNKLQDTSATATVDAEMGGIDLTDEILKATDEYQKIWQEAFDKMEANSNKWADSISKAFGALADYLRPITNFSSENFENLYNNFLKPLSTWTLGKGLPKLADVLEGFIDRIDWNDLSDDLNDFYKAIEPFVEGFGMGLIYFLDGLTMISSTLINAIGDALGLFGKAVSYIDPDVVEGLGTALGVLVPVILSMKGMSSIITTLNNVGTSIGEFIVAIASHPYASIAIGLTTLTAAVYAMYESFNKNVELETFNKNADSLLNTMDNLSAGLDKTLAGIEGKYQYYEDMASKYLELSSQYDTLSDSDKNLVKQYADELSSYSSDIVGYINDITGEWEGTNEQLLEAIKNTREYYKAQAYEKQKVGYYEATAEAELNLIELQKYFEDELGDEIKKYYKDFDIGSVDLTTGTGIEYLRDIASHKINYRGGGSEVIDDIYDAIEAWEKYQNVIDESDEKIIILDELIEDTNKNIAPSNKEINNTKKTWDSLWNYLNDKVDEFTDKTDESEDSAKSSINTINSIFKKIEPIKPTLNTEGVIPKIQTALTVFNNAKTQIDNSSLTPKLNNSSTLGSIREIANRYNAEKAAIESNKIKPTVDTSTATSQSSGLLKALRDNYSSYKINATVDTSTADKQTSGFFKSTTEKYGIIKSIIKVEEDKNSLTSLSRKITEQFQNIQLKMDIINVGKEVMATFKSIMPGFATGGFPEDGLFMANHGELVGKFSNGKTAVANNEQITQGIAQAVAPAVYNAVVSAMQSTQRGNSDVVVNIDGKQVFKAVQRQANDYTAQTGLSPFNI